MEVTSAIPRPLHATKRSLLDLRTVPVLEEPAPTITQTVVKKEPVHREEDAKYSDGDFLIISSDKVLFKIESFYMSAASAVLREAIKCSDENSKILELDDRTAEASTYIRILLDVITGQPLPSIIQGYEHTLHMVLQTARKFECVQVHYTIILYLHRSLEEKTSPYEIFLIGAIFHEPELCEKALNKIGNWSFLDDKDTPQGPVDNLVGSCGEPHNSSLVDWCKIPPAYSWAWMRAVHKEKNWEGRSKEFQILMKKIKEQKP